MNKRITIYDLAEKTGFSVGTVNRALNGKPRISPQTKQLILDAANRLGYKANTAAQGLRRNIIKIGAILFCPVKEYSDAMVEGIKSSAEDLEKYNVAVDILNIEFNSTSECCKAAVNRMQHYYESEYDGLILFASARTSELTEITEMISKFKKKGIAVATLANDITGSERDLFVGVDAITAGRLSAELLGLCCRGKNIAILTCSNDSQVNSRYLEGFADYASYEIFSSVKVYSHFDDPKLVISETDRMIKENPNLSGIYMTTASSAIACKRLIELGRNDLKIITTDILSETPSFLKSGTATATIFQNPYRQGRDVTKLLYFHITNACEEKLHLISPLAVFSSNVSDYIDAAKNC